MKRDFILNRIIKVMLLVLSMTVGQNAWAESTWEVTNENGTSNTFIIKRSEKGYEQTVHFRTISLSAYAGQHFTAVDMDYTFPANEDTKTVTVSESTPSGAYAYQTATSRKYGFEVTDRGGFQLAYAERSKTWGTSVTGSGVFSVKDVTIHSGEVTVTDGGYAQSSNPYTINSSSYCNAGTQAYLSFLNAQLRMTLNFQAKEKSDGYQYVQILVNNTTDCDTGAGDGNPGTISLSRYMAGFTIGGKGVDTYYNYSFPVTTVGNDAGATKPWTGINNTVADLEKQKFNTDCRATDGKLIIPTNFTTLVVRLNASGSDNDDWYAKNIKANIIAVDATAPTKSAVSVNPGRHAKGNTVYVSVAFSEIVTVAGTPTLTTTSDNHWGSLSYVAGSGTNVLTFSTTIPQDATGNLNVTGYSGTITDLAGNAPSSVTANNLCSLDGDLAYTISDFMTDRSGNYLITCLDDLRGLAGYVNGGGSTQSKTFLQVTDLSFPHNDNWNNANSTENNFTAIGTTSSNKPFRGTFDGQGHTISGIRIYKGDTSNQGLFGYVGGGGIVKHINLADARITGLSGTGGIVGTNNNATIEECTVATTVCIHTVQNSYNHGGIVGKNENGSVCRCISRATLTVKNGLTDCLRYGGIVGSITGYNSLITDCIADGVVIPDVNGRGAIVGDNNNGTLTRNYYLNCTVAGATESDIYTITLGTNISINHSPEATLPGTNIVTYDNGVDINGVPYAKSSSVVNLSYNPAAITEGYDVLLAVNKNSYSAAVSFTDNGDYTYTIASMPAVDITVSATEIPIISYIDADGNPQSHACTPIVSGTTGYQTFGRTDGWYVVNGDVTISDTRGIKFLDQQVNIILCDGATLTSNANGKDNIGLNAQNGSLAIYGQSLGTGSIVATASDYPAISSKTSINLNGGIISGITNSGIAAITNDSSGSITIRRGNVTATGSIFGIRDLAKSSGIVILGGTVNATATHATNGIGLYSAYGDISIMGGNVTATGSCAGIEAGGSKATTITLGCTTPADRITASSYDCATLTITDGQTLTNGEGSIISGTYTDDDLLDARSAIDHKTLQPAYSITLPDDFTLTGTTAHQGYAPAGEEVTLHTDAGYTINSASYIPVGGSATTITPMEGVWSFTLPAANTTVSAERSANTYTVHFDANYDNNGIVISGTMDDMAFTYDQAQAITSNTYERTGYTFTGWNTQSDGNGDSYTDGQSVDNFTTELNGVVTLYAQWSIIDWTGTGTSENDPYLITFASQLVKLSNDVSGGNDYTGQFFKLGNDIDMNGVAFDGIGSSYDHFMGSFDGDGHTISNVTIDRSNGINDVGFFGHILYGTVKNLIIDGASITGKNYVGGIIGYSYQTTVSNCLVLNTSITVTNGNNCGVYGYNGGSLTATNNHYNNCTVTIGETTYTTNIGVSRKDLDGVRSVYTLSLPEHVTAASAETVTIGTTTYYASEVQVTLTPDQGFSLSDVTVNGTPANHKQDGTWSFRMRAADAAVSATISVPYIDADGVEQYCTNYTLVQNSDTCVHYGSYAKENWYVVDGDVFISDPSDYAIFLIDSISHIIICDDATLVAIGNGYWGEAICNLSGEIRIYGQTLGNGFICAMGNDGSSAVLAYEGININGGDIFAQGNNYGIYSEKNITINRGTVNASGIKGDTVTINGGKVHTIDYNYGICGERYISLGWKSVDDRIFANSYITTLQNSSIIIKDTQAFADSLGNCYTGTLNQQDQLAIAGRTLQPCCIIALPEHVAATGVIRQDGITAYALPGSVITLRARMGYKMSGVAVAGMTATDNGDETYTFTMPAQNVTVSATVTDLWGIGAGKDGSTADNAYIITTTAGLDLLATLVNDGNDYNGKYFKLGGNIEYDSSIENNYTAIGTDSNPFEGIFDGNGYTVSGINIQSNESYQGLFGMIIIGEVRNLTVKGADIRGNNNVGAIAGKCEGSLENCLVIETTVSGNNDVDMICGGYGYWSLHLANCHYINCRLHNWSPGYYSTDLYTVNAGNDVLMSINSYDKGFEYNGVLYFPTEAEVILDLSYTGQVPDGDVPIFVTTEGILSKTANSYLLVVSDNETINALIGKPDINYIDSIGVAQVCPAAVPITSHEGDLEYEYGGWYVVNGQVTVNGTICFEGKTHLILCDGATLTADDIIVEFNDISIYAQSSGDDMGCINSGIYVSEELMINGGKITTKKSDIEEFKGIGLFSHDIVMYSGIINTMGDSIVCDYLVLGWRNTTDCVTAGGYRCDYFEIYPGQVLTDGNYLYYGLMNLTQIDEMSGKTLMPYQTYAVTESDGITDAIAADIAGEMVSFGRNYIEDIATTICLPFSISYVSVGEIYKFVDVSYSNRDGWVATMEELETDYDGNLVTPTEAGKPYLFIPYSTGTLSFVGRVPDDVSSVAGATTSGDWTFHGTYSRLDYGDEGFSGTVFGFAATDGKADDGVTDIEAGQFVKAANGAYILPFRAYLTYSGSNNALRAPGRDGTETPAIPSRIKVRLVRSNGITTAIGTMDRETGEVTIDQWFYLNGQPVEGAPAAPGLYLNSDGKKVMITE